MPAWERTCVARVVLDIRRPSAAECAGINFRLETDQQLAASFQHRPLDHRRLLEHQRDRPLPGQILTLGIGQFAECRAGAVEHGVEAGLVDPGFEMGAVDAVRLVIVKLIGDLVFFQPAAGLLHRVAILDAINGDGHDRSISL
ncbi:hypothetical protein RHECNPAF_2530037 [Rhizobium etli CNPAF512]|nr:hypothetical protein RHECNPAF_2530037 [Rhizobium etli CNPAF512]